MRFHPFFILTFCWTFSTSWLIAQPITFPQSGVADQRDGHYAFVNATIVTNPDQKIEGATLLIKAGRIVAVGKNITVPADAVTLDLQGKYIYPSFIELSSSYGIPDAKPAGEAAEAQPQELSNKQGAYSWNEALHPEINAAELFRADAEKAKAMRDVGFGTVLTHQADGIARGSAALVLLGDDKAHELVLQANASAHYSFNKGVSTQSYPGSLMGMIALLRQTYYDALWYKNGGKEQEFNRSLERWNELQSLPQFFHCGGLNTFRADKLGDEFDVQYIIVGDMMQYRRIEAVKQTKAAFVVPVNFPLAYDVSSPFDAQQVSLDAMKHWELAPTNPAALAQAGITFCLSADGLKDKSEFLAQVRKAYQFGLSEADALRALTTTPAQLLRVDKEIGSLDKGKWANFIITSGNILSETCTIYHNWVKGKPYIVKEIATTDPRGKYELALQGTTYYLSVEGSAEEPTASINTDASKKEGDKVALTVHHRLVDFSFVPKKDTTLRIQPTWRFSGTILPTGNWSGRATLPDGTWFDWVAKRSGDVTAKPLELPKRDSSVLGAVLYPFNGYGNPANSIPKQETFLFKNATVWTNEAEGILTNTDVLVEKGKIAKIGKGLSAANALVIDASNKHLTSGIIDEHSHIGISAGVNEATQASSAEVRIGDVINSEDVNIYRQLAGGVTIVHQLHGSANPIGGQSAISKLRWGQMPEEMKVENAKGFIKFALGENVKQSNWGDNHTTRFPQSRMGVEQVYEDYFTRAREYGEAFKKDKKGTRRDLDLDAVLEILNKERFISCHSYVQSEITMLMRVAEKHGFRVNTFTHILEGYKVADKMKQHGAGGSSFSDWWAYKYEVLDAIPYNAKILDTVGVVTAINSDDAEMARRLNQEAAKGVKYGNMSEEAAWKMVTLNPAKLLRIDDRVGSIRTGKDADLVLWSDNPLSIYARVERTLVDGISLFDLQQDTDKRRFIQSERNRLIQKMLQAKTEGAKTQPAIHVHEHHYHCGDDNLNLLRYQSGE